VGQPYTLFHGCAAQQEGDAQVWALTVVARKEVYAAVLAGAQEAVEPLRTCGLAVSVHTSSPQGKDSAMHGRPSSQSAGR